MLFDAHLELRRLLLGKPRPPFTPIQCFGLPLNEFLPDACRLQSTAQGSAAEVSLLASAAIPQPTEIDHG